MSNVRSEKFKEGIDSSTNKQFQRRLEELDGIPGYREPYRLCTGRVDVSLI